MSNRNRMIKKNDKCAKRASFLAAAVLAAALITGQTPMSIISANAAQEQETPEDMFPDNITISEPTELRNIELPGNEYGTLEWADGSYVPAKRVESCQVILIPADGQDLSHVEGWDEESGQVVGYINVIVANLEETDESTDENEKDDSEDKTQITQSPEQEKDITLTPSETPEAEKNDSSISEQTPEATGEPACEPEEIPSETPEATVTEMPSEKPSENEDGNKKTEEELQPTEAPDPSENIFDNPIQPEEKDDRPSDADESLSEEEKEERAQINHTCDGITVSGANLPWYVQFRVSSGDNYRFTNEDDATIFQSYEFELWDLQNNTEYEIPSGEYISVTVPVKVGYQYTIEHLLDNGATEMIIPSVEGDVMVFSTHSFSPFGIAGSKQLVGPDSSSDSQADPTAAPTSAPQTTVAGTKAADNDNNTVVTDNDENADTDNSGNNTSSDSSQTTDNGSAKSDSVETGDTTNIVPFIVLIVAAVVIIGAVILMKKRKK